MATAPASAPPGTPRLLPPSRLDLLAACLRGDVPERADWETVVAAANDSLVAPALHRALRRSDGLSRVDPEALDYLEDLDAANRERNRRLASQLAEIVAAAAAAGVGLSLIKGAVTLSEAADPSDVSRMLYDLDILIDPSDGATLDGILRDLGYRAFEDSANDYSRGSFHRDDVVGAVDVHQALPERFLGLLTPDDLDRHMVEAVWNGTALRVPDASLRIAMNIAHEMLHDRGIFTGFVHMRYLLELIDLCGRPGQAIDWDWLDAKCSSRRFALGFELQCRLVGRLFPAVPFPRGPRTRAGGLLYRRCLLKGRFHRLGALEWRLILGLRRTRTWIWLRRPRR